MTINVTKWSPDTCGCVHNYSWDDSVPQDQRVHTHVSSDVLCSFHQGLADAKTAYDTVIEENTRKNISLQHLIDNFPAQLSDTGAAGGNLKAGLTFNYSISGTAPNRVFTISFTGITLTAAQRTNIQSKLDTRFGAGKVILG